MMWIIIEIGTVIAVPIIAIILVVKLTYHVTLLEAIDIIFKKLDSVNKESVKNNVFNVFIGWNGYAYIPAIIEDKFKNLRKYWKIVYSIDVVDRNTNYIIYKFKVNDTLNPNMERRRLLQLAQSVSEQALTEHMHEAGVFLTVDAFIAVILQGDVLNVIIAKNIAGFEEIKRFRRQSH